MLGLDGVHCLELALNLGSPQPITHTSLSFHKASSKPKTSQGNYVDSLLLGLFLLWIMFILRHVISKGSKMGP